MRGELYLIYHAKILKLLKTCVSLSQQYGLISWGYFKLIFDSLLIALESCSLLDTLYNLCANDTFCSIYISDIILNCILIFIFATDFWLTTIHVIGGDMKNVKLLMVIYYYNQVMWVIVVLLTAVSVGISIENVLRGFYPIDRWIWPAVNFFFYFVNIIIQTYFLLLLRSEIIKLNSNCEYRFVNNAADAKFTNTMIRKDDVIDGQKGIETA